MLEPRRALRQVRRGLFQALPGQGQGQERGALTREALPRILDDLAIAGTDGATGSEAGWRLSTLADRGHGPLIVAATAPRAPDRTSFVVKVATDPEGAERLDQEAATLRALHAREALGDWRGLLPELVAVTRDGRMTVVVTSRLPGRPPELSRRDPRRRGRLLVQAASAIRTLHTTTGERRSIDQFLADAWVRRPITRLEGALQDAGMMTFGGRPLARIEDALLNALSVRPPMVSVIHGDYRPENLLLGSDGEISGIVDWEASGPAGSPAVDLVGFLVASALVRTQRSFGESIAESLSALRSKGGLEVDVGERAVWEAVDQASMAPRTSLLLAWLARVHADLVRQPGLGRDQVWLQRNLEPVRHETVPIR